MKKWKVMLFLVLGALALAFLIFILWGKQNPDEDPDYTGKHKQRQFN